jgi:hypothetical protein
MTHVFHCIAPKRSRLAAKSMSPMDFGRDSQDPCQFRMRDEPQRYRIIDGRRTDRLTHEQSERGGQLVGLNCNCRFTRPFKAHQVQESVLLQVGTRTP